MKISSAIAYLQNLPADEPVFVLRGQDLLAPSTILYWCRLHALHDGSALKRSEATGVAQELMGWFRKKLPD